jgi:GNAT superfamily N-acetyltransferase
MNSENELKIISVANPSKEELKEIFKLKKLCFINVDEKEIKEDFYHLPSIQILAYDNSALVGWAGVHITEQNYRGRQIKLGGYGICTHPDFRQMGIATKVAEEGMKYLKENGCDIGFLSVNPNDEKSIKLHQRYGFVMLPQHFSWKSSKDVFKEDIGGMIAPIGSNELFNYVLNGRDTFYVGNGYW